MSNKVKSIGNIIATVFLVCSIFSSKVTKTINKKFPNSNAEEGHGNTIAKTGFNFVLLIFSLLFYFLGEIWVVKGR